MTLHFIDSEGWYSGARRADSPHYNERPEGAEVTLAVLHNISLPPNRFSGSAVEDFFRGCLDCSCDPQLADLAGVRVSSHFFVRRDGEVIQFVSCEKRAWHAGVSSFYGQENCNDFSVGIEIEGSDFVPFAPVQYEKADEILFALKRRYPIACVCGHSDIAPGRKTDPGPFFDWQKLAIIKSCPTFGTYIRKDV
jgi:AmpD protein